MPDPQMLPVLHYKDYQSTPLTKENGDPRDVDDFQPRVQKKQLYVNGEIASEDGRKFSFPESMPLRKGSRKEE